MNNVNRQELVNGVREHMRLSSEALFDDEVDIGVALGHLDEALACFYRLKLAGRVLEE